jgi:hypothetical protein
VVLSSGGQSLYTSGFHRSILTRMLSNWEYFRLYLRCNLMQLFLICRTGSSLSFPAACNIFFCLLFSFSNLFVNN